MKYGKIENGVLRFAPRMIHTTIDGTEYVVYNPTVEMLQDAGYCPVIFVEPGEAPAGYHYEETYTEWQTETGREILQEWMLVEDPDEIGADEALEIILGGDGT